MSANHLFTKRQKEPDIAERFGRRNFIRYGLTSLFAFSFSSSVFAKTNGYDFLTFFNTHTRERMRILYTPGIYKGSVSSALQYFLRDFRTGDTHPIDPALLDSLWAIQEKCGTHTFYEVVSGYRSPKTNEFLRKHSDGVDPNSLHMQGRAIDVRLVGVELDHLREVAMALHPGGVGFYPQSNFIHIDTGEKRHW
ncbi:MAG: Twin-arginine translocation pathway signal [Desulfobacterales bacterium]|nr:MAG: Twin-arginine translocation pathway signal [Desulfobacterales bacterium]